MTAGAGYNGYAKAGSYVTNSGILVSNNDEGIDVKANAYTFGPTSEAVAIGTVSNNGAITSHNDGIQTRVTANTSGFGGLGYYDCTSYATTTVINDTGGAITNANGQSIDAKATAFADGDWGLFPTGLGGYATAKVRRSRIPVCSIRQETAASWVARRPMPQDLGGVAQLATAAVVRQLPPRRSSTTRLEPSRPRLVMASEVIRMPRPPVMPIRLSEAMRLPPRRSTTQQPLMPTMVITALAASRARTRAVTAGLIMH